MNRLLTALALAQFAVPAVAGPGHACTTPVQECVDTFAKQMDGRGWLGIKMEMHDDGTVTVMEVVAKSPAATAGLMPGDRLVGLEGARLGQATEAEMEKARKGWKPGVTLTYAVERAGKEMPVTVTLAEMPDAVRYEAIGQHVLEMHASAAHAASVKEMGVEDVAKAVEAGKAHLFDVNGAEIRAKFGVVPKATLLASSSGYDLGALPKDKGSFLVFYCANTRCTASDTAAKRALEAGYAHVAVMRPGIAGWKDAGQPTAKPSQS